MTPAEAREIVAEYIVSMMVDNHIDDYQPRDISDADWDLVADRVLDQLPLGPSSTRYAAAVALLAERAEQ